MLFQQYGVSQIKTVIETVRVALITATEALKEAGIETPEVEAEFLLTYLLNIKRHELFLNPEKRLTEEQSLVFKDQISRRSAEEPCQYITGRTEFMGLQIEVTPDTLIPRPETELIAEEVIGRFSRIKERTQDSASPLILDLCTGSGCLAVSIAVLLPGVRLVATDLSAAALEVARENARNHNVESSIEFLQGDLFNALRGSTGKTLFKAGFDLIISNPPYINSFDLAGLQREVIGHEPLSALDGGRDGLDIIKEIITQAPAHLKPGAELIMEIGYDQAAAVTALLKASKYRSFSIKKDFSGIDRMVAATTCTKE